MKKQNLVAFVMMLDLVKEYEKVNCLYLIQLLLHSSRNQEIIEWIMGFLSFVSFTVVINGFRPFSLMHIEVFIKGVIDHPFYISFWLNT